MKIPLTTLLAIAALALSALSAEYQFYIPGAFLVSPHGTLNVSAPDGWSVTSMYDEDDGTTTNSTPPQFPGPSIVAKNSTGAEVFIRLMDIEERNVIARINDVFGKDSNGIPLPWAPIQGAYAKGNICFQNPASPTRAHGDLETGRLLLLFFDAKRHKRLAADSKHLGVIPIHRKYRRSTMGSRVPSTRCRVP